MRRGRRVLMIALGVMVLLIAARIIWGLVQVPPGCVRVERGDLVLGVEVAGILRAVESTVIMPPQVQDMWQFKIAMMADEGTEITMGQQVLAFDASELQQSLQSKLADLDSARTEVEKKKVDVAVTIANDGLALAEVEARLRKARLIAEQPSDLYPSIEVQKSRLDLELAELEVDLVRRRIDATRRAGGEELGVLEANHDHVASDVQRIQDAITRMTISAPRDGILIHVTDWRNEKKKVGDTCWIASAVLEIPDLSRMEADGEVEEAQAGRVRDGQPVALHLDAHPDHEYYGSVKTISRAVQANSWRNPQKVVSLTLSLDETDPDRMRPGMRFRGSIEIERHEDVTLLPVEAVFRVDGETVAYRHGFGGLKTVPVILGDRNADHVEVIEGLEPGDSVSLEQFP